MKIDLFVDLDTEDETGLPSSYLDQVADPTVIVPGRLIVVGSGSAVSTSEVIDVGIDVCSRAAGDSARRVASAELLRLPSDERSGRVSLCKQTASVSENRCLKSPKRGVSSCQRRGLSR